MLLLKKIYIMRYIRVKISFLVLKATLLCLRGSRSLRQNIDVGGEDFSQSLRELGLWTHFGTWRIWFSMGSHEDLFVGFAPEGRRSRRHHVGSWNCNAGFLVMCFRLFPSDCQMEWTIPFYIKLYYKWCIFGLFVIESFIESKNFVDFKSSKLALK